MLLLAEPKFPVVNFFYPLQCSRARNAIGTFPEQLYRIIAPERPL
jgi:hypothetical protein